MTQREFLTLVSNGQMTEEIQGYAVQALETLDREVEKRREAAARKRAEKEVEKAPLREAILHCITTEPKTATTLIEEAGVEIKPQVIPSLLKQLIESGVVEKTDVKVTGKGTQRGYKMAE